jgi:hypothetical protein
MARDTPNIIQIIERIFALVQVGLASRQGYVPEKRSANRTQNSNFKQCSWAEGIDNLILYSV